MAKRDYERELARHGVRLTRDKRVDASGNVRPSSRPINRETKASVSSMGLSRPIVKGPINRYEGG